MQDCFNRIVEGAIEGPREAQAPWGGEEYKRHAQGRVVGDILVIILIALLACHIILPPWRLWLFVDNKAHLTLEPVGHRLVHHFLNLQFPLNSICPMQGNF